MGEHACPYCGGTGAQIGFDCSACDSTGRVRVEPVEAEKHDRAWRIPTDDGSDYGVLVEIQHVKADRRHWFLICPADSTLYVPDDDGTVDLTDCCSGASCDFLDDTHIKAHELVRTIERERSP